MFGYTIYSMLSGKQFRLGRATVALEAIGGTRSLVTVPKGAIIRVTSGPPGPGVGTVGVLWEGRTLAMFAVDVEQRGTEDTDPTGQSASA